MESVALPFGRSVPVGARIALRRRPAAVLQKKTLKLVSIVMALVVVVVVANAGSSVASNFVESKISEPMESSASDVVSSLQIAAAKVAFLRAQVDEGHIVPGFGAQAAAIVEGMPLVAHKAVDGALHALFLRQVALLRQKLAVWFEEAVQHDFDSAATEAVSQFDAEGQTLLRPGSAWSYEKERASLISWMQDTMAREAMLAEERAQAARGQRVTVEVIGKLQSQMETLQQKAQGLRSGGSPWVLSTSYRIPNTPLQVVGKYEQGRANVELNLTPLKDPANSEAGLADSFGPANVGISFNLGL